MSAAEYKSLEVVLKIAGRCNINCSYCYMFNKNNDDYKSQPVYMSETTLYETIDFLIQGIRDLNIPNVFIIFHGGEPMMMKINRFEQFCIILRERLLPHVATLKFQIQTNGTLINSEWLKLFARYKVSVGISLDGPEDYNDQGRIDHQGRGTYQSAVNGLHRTQNAIHHGLLKDTGIICVANPEHDGKRIYRHFVDDLKIHWISFLMPMESVDTFDMSKVDAITHYFIGIFEEWIKDNNPGITVRLFENFLTFLTQKVDGNRLTLTGEPSGVIILPIASNGDVSVDDESKPINFGQAIQNVRTSTLRQHTESIAFNDIKELMHTVPLACQDCEWVGYCRGGAQNQNGINRFSEENYFNNRSIFCATYKELYSRVARYMLDNGMPEEQLLNVLYLSTKDIRFGDMPFKSKAKKLMLKQI